MVSTFSRGMDQPTGIIIIVDNVLARGKLNRENVFFPLSPFAPENLLERDMFGRPRRLASARSFSTLRPNHQSSIINHQSSIINMGFLPLPARVPIHTVNCHWVGPPVFIGSPRVCVPMAFFTRHRASNPQGSFSNGCCQLVHAFIFS